MSYIQELFAQRLGGNQFGKDDTVYKFEKIKRAKAKAREMRPELEIIDFGVGESDDMAPIEIRDQMKIEIDQPENRGYTDNGTDAFKMAAAKYLEKVYHVKGIEPSVHIQPTIGSKHALAMTPLIYINPGDVSLLTVPGYPVLGTHTKYLGGDVYQMPLKAANDFFPDFTQIPKDICDKAKLLYINYPNNPTGKGGTEDFFKKAVDFALANELVIVQDAAYGRLDYTGSYLSILSIPGAMDCAIELHSFSKMFNMTGWRLAFAAGNELVIAGLREVKDNSDSGQFGAILKAGQFGMEHYQIADKIVTKISRRLDKMVALLNHFGFDAKKPDGTFYLYFRSPKGIKNGPRFETGEAFSQWMITEKSISTVPWDDAGNYVRFSATFIAPTEAEEDKVISEVENRLQGIEFEF
jgi:LL-diaminopimelate aminotransferase